MSKSWVTVQECIGLPGFPTTAPAVRKRLDDLSAGNDKLKRKRSGGKAFEYHISVLPRYVRNSLDYEQHSDEESRDDEIEAEMVDVWLMIFKLMTPYQQRSAIELFKNHGLNALLPSIANGDTGKEILQQRDTTQNAASASNVSTQGKKAS